MKKLIPLLLFIFSSVSISSELTPEKIKLNVSRHGYQYLTHNISASYWHVVVIKNIADGNADWLAILPWLAEVSNSDRINSLMLATQLALVKKPLETLKITSKSNIKTAKNSNSFDTSSICTGLFPWVTKKSYLNYYSSAHKSLLAAGEPAKKCLKELDDTYEEIIADAARGVLTWGINVIPGY